MPAAAVVGGIVAGAGAIGAAAIGSSAQRSASRDATQAAQDATAQNTALQREVYAQNQAILNPYVQRGNAAGEQINALLGLGGGTTNSAGSAFIPGYTQQPIGAGYGTPTPAEIRPALGAGGYEIRDPLYYIGQDMMSQGNGPAYGIGAATPATQTRTAQQAANDAFDIFKNSTGYQFRVNEGTNALNSGYAGSGLLQSGAALRALDDYRQNMASNEFGNYMAYLGNQQGVGLSGASAVAGVGQNYANSISNQNNAMASVLANSALARGQNSAAMWGGVGNALGQVGGIIAGRG